jgi:hypothetical protein
MKEQPDKARVVFSCSGCAAKADLESALTHEEKPHERKIVRTCTKSGTLPHALRPATTSVTKDGKFTEQWYGFRLKKTDGLSILDSKKLSQDTLLVMADKEAKDTFWVQVDPKHSARTLAEITDVVAAQLKAQVDVKEKSEVDFAGTKAVKIVYEVDQKAKRRVTTWYVKHDGNFLLFSATDAEPFDNHEKQFKALIDSVELLK